MLGTDCAFCPSLAVVETCGSEPYSFKITLHSNKGINSDQSNMFSAFYFMTNINHRFGSFLGWLLKSSWLWMKDSMMERCEMRHVYLLTKLFEMLEKSGILHMVGIVC